MRVTDELVARLWDALVKDGWKTPSQPTDAISKFIESLPDIHDQRAALDGVDRNEAKLRNHGKPVPKEFRDVLKEWMGEMEFQAPNRCPDGTPKMGKFETEELFRAGKKLLAEPESKTMLPFADTMGG